MEDSIIRNDTTYISTSVAAKISGYTRDYVGQLAREGRVESIKVGRARYVEKDSLKDYLEDRKGDQKDDAENEVEVTEKEIEEVTSETHASDDADEMSKVFVDLEEDSDESESESVEEEMTIEDNEVDSALAKESNDYESADDETVDEPGGEAEEDIVGKTNSTVSKEQDDGVDGKTDSAEAGRDTSGADDAESGFMLVDARSAVSASEDEEENVEVGSEYVESSADQEGDEGLADESKDIPMEMEAVHLSVHSVDESSDEDVEASASSNGSDSQISEVPSVSHEITGSVLSTSRPVRSSSLHGAGSDTFDILSPFFERTNNGRDVDDVVMRDVDSGPLVRRLTTRQSPRSNIDGVNTAIDLSGLGRWQEAGEHYLDESGRRDKSSSRSAAKTAVLSLLLLLMVGSFVAVGSLENQSPVSRLADQSNKALVAAVSIADAESFLGSLGDRVFEFFSGIFGSDEVAPESSDRLADGTATEPLSVSEELIERNATDDFGTGGPAPPGSGQGFVVVPAQSEDPDERAAHLAQIRQQFSDEVDVTPSEDNTSGTIQPVFRNSTGTEYLYMMVPVESQQSTSATNATSTEGDVAEDDLGARDGASD